MFRAEKNENNVYPCKTSVLIYIIGILRDVIHMDMLAHNKTMVFNDHRVLAVMVSHCIFDISYFVVIISSSESSRPGRALK